MHNFDLTIIGGGIVGVATALQLKRRYNDASILLLEKEVALAYHQTGHNSGVIHAGVYYQPGSLKADFCKRGADLTFEFCREHNLPYEQCGKMLVVTNATEFSRMKALEKRCIENGITTHRLSEVELKEREPHIIGLAALFVPTTGITNYSMIALKMAKLFVSLGGEVKLCHEVKAMKEGVHTVRIDTNTERFKSKYLVACGGLHADRLAKKMGINIDFRIIPFRGEYYQLPAERNNMINHLIYPIPDPELPFLGVHLTRMIDGSITVGPNAVLGWKREGYGRYNLDLIDSLDMLVFPGFWKIIRDNFISGLSEIKDSIYKRGYLERVRKYCPCLSVSDLRPYPAGIRAQAVRKDGTLVHDFLFVESKLTLHVCNAPSPAATSAIPISEYLCDKVKHKFGF